MDIAGAFNEMARKKNAKRITCGHKSNIMKITDGLFVECFYEIAKDYPELKADDVIVDDLCMKLVTRPDLFDVVVLTNLQGDIVSDLQSEHAGGRGQPGQHRGHGGRAASGVVSLRQSA